MKIHELKELIKSHTRLDKPAPIIIEGEMGIGKSQVVQQVAEELRYTYVDLRLAQQEPGDLIGMPRVVDGVTIWSRPSWMPEENAKLVLALEELNRAPIDVQQAIFQALTENKIHTHKLPAKTIIVLCINPSDSMYHVSDLDPAMISRCIKVKLDYDVDEWLKFAYEKKLDDRIIQFISVHRDLLCQPKENEPSPLPRTWHLLSNELKVVPDELLFEVSAGLVGKEAAVTFQKFCDKEYKKPVTGKEILEHYDKVKEKLSKQRNDENWVTARDLVNYISKSKLRKSEIENLNDYLLNTKAEWKVEIISNLPETILIELSKTKLVEEMASIINQVQKAAKEDSLK